LSEIRVTTVSDTAGTGPVTLTKQSASKAWARFNGSSFSTSGDSTFNITSLTDDGTGDYTITIASDFSNANFVQLSSGNEFNTLNDGANTAGTMQFGNYNNSGSRTDTARCFVAGFGDLA
tara:strand:+ start:323 stop:682 length:360 start_codon:yes stop_codon:yes gene_type:complete